MQTKELFGGAILAGIPARFADVSDFRQVPDHQEVFADARTDESLIIEILEMVPHSNEEALEYHFNELATSNAAVGRILNQTLIPKSDLPNLGEAEFVALFLSGEQEIAKYKESATNLIGIFLLLIRLPNVTTDLLISYNIPKAIAPESSSWGADVRNPSDPSLVLKEFASSFRIENWGLFG